MFCAGIRSSHLLWAKRSDRFAPRSTIEGGNAIGEYGDRALLKAVLVDVLIRKLKAWCSRKVVYVPICICNKLKEDPVKGTRGQA